MLSRHEKLVQVHVHVSYMYIQKCRYTSDARNRTTLYNNVHSTYNYFFWPEHIRVHVA